MWKRGTRLRRAWCRTTVAAEAGIDRTRLEHLLAWTVGHQWGHLKGDPENPGVLVSECLRQCGAVRRLRLDVPNTVSVRFEIADPAKVRLDKPAPTAEPKASAPQLVRRAS